jgi:exonuclease SbcC
VKLHALEADRVRPFRETQRVDFDAFDRDGIFLISGAPAQASRAFSTG